jgi:pimeloyl-ACP methyl ester carboxylesterase
MPVIFVHGVPDTYRVWDRVRSRLSRTDIATLALPGFDSPVPAGFTATKEEYVAWIIERLEQYSQPVDLVGHDWGCILSVRVASLRPDLVRTWAAGSGPVSRDYKWHELAKIWQTPNVGEQWMHDLDEGELSHQLESYGVPADLASEMVGRMDETMKDCILKLYRSAIDVGDEWEPGLANITSPGLVFWGKLDPFCPIEFADRLGKDTKAAQVLKLDCGHWTPVQRPSEIVQALQEHWSVADLK